jgi:hypothetical protein
MHAIIIRMADKNKGAFHYMYTGLGKGHPGWNLAGAPT